MLAETVVELDGENLTIEQLVRVARNPSVTVECEPSAMQRVQDSADLVSRVVESYKESVKREDPDHPPILDYGITTGFGEFKRIPIDPGSLNRLQENILLSHAAGVGETLDEDDLSNYYPAEIVRAVLVLRINAFLKGRSGIRPAIVRILVEMVNKRVIPLVPIRGSVGSSGDLAPLAHLFLVLCKAGRDATRFYQLSADGQSGALVKAIALPDVLSTKVEPEVSAKEGLALTNGATFSAAMLALAVHDATSLALAADVAVAMCAEALLGCARAFDERVHEARRQKGQIHSARCVRSFLEGSRLLERASEVQDPYSIRCAPAVHGASLDTLEFAREVVSRELNAATDNPLLFGHEHAWDQRFSDNWRWRRNKRLSSSSQNSEPYEGKDRSSYSAGNFHGQPIALAADFLAIALAEFADISERRTQLLLDGNHNRMLPANLIANAGLNSGFMIAQYCAAGLVSENKVLTHPASVDSIPTSSNTEDHNSMATIAARKLRTVLANTRHALAIELLVATQALEWATLFEELNANSLPPDYTELRLKYLDSLDGDRVQENKQEQFFVNLKERWNRGRTERELFEKWTQADNRTRIVEWLGCGPRETYLAIRESVDPMLRDRVLDKDIRLVATLLAPGADRLASLVTKVEAFTLTTTERSGHEGE